MISMKYFSISLLILICVSLQLTGKTIIIERNGDKDATWENWDLKFSKVEENHNTKENPDVSCLICQGKGNIDCRWITSPASSKTYPYFYINNMIEHAKIQMKKGNWQGSFQSNFEHKGIKYKRIVNWTGKAPQINKISIVIEKIEEI